MGDINSLRKNLRAQRREIRGEKRHEAAMVAADAVMRFVLSKPGLRRIGVYLAMDEEIDTQPLIQRLLNEAYELFVPVVVDHGNALIWRPYYRESVLERDVLNMWVPSATPGVADLSGVPEIGVAPLVGYDREGHRLGMGGGFYDRSFSGKLRGQIPWLIGFAYSCQERPHIPHFSWDVPLDALASEKGLLFFT